MNNPNQLFTAARSAFSAAGQLLLKPAIGYSVCVILDKGFSFITIPLVTNYLTPAEYGHLDIAASFIEFVNIIFLFGLADTAIRLISEKRSETETHEKLAGLLGAGVLFAVVCGALVQTMVPSVSRAFGVPDLESGLHWAIAAVCCAGLLEMPLALYRFRGRVGTYLGYIILRSLLQFSATIFALTHGWGANGMLTLNGAILLTLASMMALLHAKQHGCRLTLDGVWLVLSYGLPLVGGALAMFLIGSCSRWFLSGTVPADNIAFLALATKFAALAALLTQPFMLWWRPRRLRALSRANHLEDGMREWNLGFFILISSALVVCLAAPVFVELLLKPWYRHAVALIPYMVLIVVLNELCTLCSVGAYIQRTSFGLMGVNMAAALVTVTGFWLTISTWGMGGAIGSMIAGQTLRLVIFIAISSRLNVLTIPVLQVVSIVGLAVGLLLVAPSEAYVSARIFWSLSAGAALVGASAALGIIDLNHLRRLLT